MNDDKFNRFLVWAGNLLAIFDAVVRLISFGYINSTLWFRWTGIVSERRSRRLKRMINDKIEKILRELAV